MIAIGFTSGLDSIACSVLAVTSEKTETLWSEVMSGPRKKRAVSPMRRYHAHKLMLDMFFERWPPAVIGLGPPSKRNEPIEWVVLMRTALFELGKSLRVPVILFDNDQAIVRGMGMSDDDRSGLKSLIKRDLPDFSSTKRRVILSTATALAAATTARHLYPKENQ